MADPQPSLFASRAMVAAQLNAERFTAEFLAYLQDNLHVYAAFEREALKVSARGFKRYSARTIVEVLRHHSALQDSDARFKLNDRFTPGWARLFALMHPEAADLFEFREAKSVRRDWGLAGVAA